LVVARIFRRLGGWHEHLCSALVLKLSAGVTCGTGCRAGYGLRLRASMGGQIRLGDRVSIDRWVDFFANNARLEVGSGCHFGKGCVIVAREAVTIGPDCQIAEHVTIRDQDHRIVPGQPVAQSGYETAPILIGANVWIGAGVVITRGVTIGDNAVIGAGAVVTRDIPAGARAAGVPARPLQSAAGPDKKAALP